MKKRQKGAKPEQAKEKVVTNTINITMPVNGLDGTLLKELKMQQVIEQELK